jgi:hypothetical protein
VPDCLTVDLCPDDAVKTTPGVCGCGAPDVDANGDGVLDCLLADLCPEDPDKALPGVCGCGVPDADNNNDGISDCLDLCPADPAKVVPGACGCGRADVPDCGAGSPIPPPGDGDGDGGEDETPEEECLSPLCALCGLITPATLVATMAGLLALRLLGRRRW